MHVRSDRRFHLDAPVERVWVALARPERYPTWWPWLDLDATALEPGERWRCTVRAPLGYRVRFDVEIVAVTAPSPSHGPGVTRAGSSTGGRAVAATVGVVDGRVSGDVSGSATVIVEPAVDGVDRWCELRLVSDLVASGPFLRWLARVAPSIARRSHDRIIDRGVSQFAGRGLR